MRLAPRTVLTTVFLSLIILNCQLVSFIRKIVTRAVCCGTHKRCPINSHNKPRSSNSSLNIQNIINIFTGRHLRDWTCRIDVRRTFGINPRDVSMPALSSAINQASHYLRLHPLEQVEVHFRAGTYHISAGDKPGIQLRHLKPENNGRFIISGAGKWTLDKSLAVQISIQNCPNSR